MKSRYSLALLVTSLLLVCGVAQAQQPFEVEALPDATTAKQPAVDSSEAVDPGIQAPTLRGPTGLFRLVTTDVGNQHTFRVALHTELYSGTGFLTTNDDNARFAGTIAASYTPWRYLELFANIRSQANSNERDDAARLDDEVIFALGDFGFGGKLRYPVAPFFGLGMTVGLDFLNSVGGVSLDGDAVGFNIGMLSSLDLDPLADVPWRFHFNFGYVLDNSDGLASFPSYPLASLQVEKFALGIKPSRLQIKLGTDFSLRRWLGFGLMPMLEFAFDVATGEGDEDFADPRFYQPQGLLDPEEYEGRLTAWMTIGARVNPVKGLNVEMGWDVGINSPGYGFGPPVMPWNMILGLSYAYDPAPPVKVVTKERVQTVVKAPPVGKIRGRVVSAKTLEPVDGAVVTFPGRDLTGLSSDPDGGFLTYGFPAGRVQLMVRHPDHLPAKLQAEIKEGAITAVEVKVEAAPPKVGTVRGKVLDTAGAAVAAQLSITGVESKQVRAAADGTYAAELQPGSYNVAVEAEGYLRKEQDVALTAGATATINFTISPKPKRSLVRVTRRAIVIRKKVHFATNTAEIRPDSRQLLDEVAHVLLSNERIQKVEIGGHTDDRGSDALNMKLSQQRAEAVRDYLVQAGVPTERLEAKGYGPTRPKVPNITSRNRARNRRVEFRILAQQR